MPLPFRQVNVFSADPLLGNPVAVVHDADGLSAEQMAAFARWTNLSETTFLLRPMSEEADYRLRIFTPGGELPFAGHPTLGSGHAWLEAGGVPNGEHVVQECGVGLVHLRHGDRLAFAAPPLIRTGPVEDGDLDRIAAALRIDRADVVDSQWADNGAGWVAVRLRDAAAVLALEPDFTAFDPFDIGVVGLCPPGGERVRATGRHPRGPGHRLPQRSPRPVAHGQRHPAAVVRRRAGYGARPRRPGAHRHRRRRHDLGRRRDRDHDQRHRRPLRMCRKSSSKERAAEARSRRARRS